MAQIRVLERLTTMQINACLLAALLPLSTLAAAPCGDLACDSAVVRALLDANGQTDVGVKYHVRVGPPGRVTALDLSYLALTKIPAELARLDSLRELDLRGVDTALVSLSPEVLAMPGLRILADRPTRAGARRPWAVTAGPNYSHVRLSDKADRMYDSLGLSLDRWGFFAGALWSKSLSPGFGIAFGAVVESKGWEEEATLNLPMFNRSMDLHSTIQLYYLQLPVTGYFLFPLGEVSDLRLGAGVEPGILLHSYGKVHVVEHNGAATSVRDTSMNDVEGLNAIDFGVHLLAEYTPPIWDGRLFLTAAYYYGLASLGRDPDETDPSKDSDEAMYHRNLKVGLGIRFP